VTVERELRDHATYVALERVFGRWVRDQIRAVAPSVLYGYVRALDPGRTASLELDGPTAPQTTGVAIGEHSPLVGDFVRVFGWPARNGGAPELWIDAILGRELDPTSDEDNPLQTSVTRIGADGAGDFIVRERLENDSLFRLVYGLDADDHPRELWGNGTVQDVRRRRTGSAEMTFDDGDGGRVGLFNSDDQLLDTAIHGATGDPHGQYVLESFYARTSTPGLPRIIRSGSLTTTAITAPGVQEASVTLSLGLTFPPFVLGMYAADNGRTVAVPDVTLNAAGQILDAVQLSTQVVSTNKTKVTATVQTSRPKGRGPVSFRYMLLDRAGG
jgi:hypothetical protein